MQSQINFEPLKQMDDIELGGQIFDMSQPLSSLKKIPPIDILIIIIIIVAAIFLTVHLGSFGLLLVLGAPGYIFGKQLNKQKTSTWRLFAQVNSWQILPNSSAKSLIPPSLEGQGHSFNESEVINGVFSEVPFKLFRHNYTIGYGKNSQTFIYTIMVLNINIELAHLLLKSSKAGVNSSNKDLVEKLQLEGDFNKYFKVYISPGQEVDDLQILTPDLMQFLIRSDSSFNLEMLGDNIFIIASQDLRTYDRLPALYNFSAEFYAQLKQNLPMSQINNAPVVPAAKPAV